MNKEIEDIIKRLTPTDWVRVGYKEDSKTEIFEGYYYPVSEEYKSKNDDEFIVLQRTWTDPSSTHHLHSKRIYLKDIYFLNA